MILGLPSPGTYPLTILVSHLTRLCVQINTPPEIASDYAWQLLSLVLKLNRTSLWSTAYVTLTTQGVELLHQSLLRLKDHEPLQYIVGTISFLNLTIKVKAPILIPRPETEEWVHHLLQAFPALAQPDTAILDLCTGSGCIALGLAHALGQADILGTDINPLALELAQENRRLNSITNCSFAQGNLFEAVSPDATYHLIVANPPYLSYDEWDSIEPSVQLWESQQALCTGQEGFELLKKIIIEAPSYLKGSPHKPALLAVEIAPWQTQKASELMACRGYANITIYTDIAGKQRAIIGTWIPKTAIP